jgi:hypothetical protein
MVDPIEVKLDEIDAKIDQIAYSPKYKQTYEIDEMMKKSGGGGAVAGGAAAGGIAAGILILADVLKDAIRNSKIISKSLELVGNALGLLIDLVLLPFLPIIAGGLIMLYQGIIAFGMWWKDVWSTIQKGGIVALLSMGLKFITDTLQTWGQGLLDYLFGKGTVKNPNLALSIGVMAIAKTIFQDLPLAILTGILDLLFGKGSTANLIKAVQLQVNLALGDPLGWLSSVVKGIFQPKTGTQFAISFLLNPTLATAGWLSNFIKACFGGGLTNGITLPAINLPFNFTLGSTPTSTSTQTQHNTILVNGGGNSGGTDIAAEIVNALTSFGSGWFK